MSKIIMLLHLPEPKIRKRAIKAVQKHKDKTKYTRKCKHKATEIGGLTVFKFWRTIKKQPNSRLSPQVPSALQAPW